MTEITLSEAWKRMAKAPRPPLRAGRPGVPAHLAVTRVHFVRTIAGAEGTRLSLRPLRFSRASHTASLRALRAARRRGRVFLQDG